MDQQQRWEAWVWWSTDFKRMPVLVGVFTDSNEAKIAGAGHKSLIADRRLRVNAMVTACVPNSLMSKGLHSKNLLPE